MRRSVGYNRIRRGPPPLRLGNSQPRRLPAARAPGLVAVWRSGRGTVWATERGVTGLAWTPGASLGRAAERLAVGEPRLVDVGEANGHLFLLWAGAGVDARVGSAVEPRARWMKLVPTALETAA